MTDSEMENVTAAGGLPSVAQRCGGPTSTSPSWRSCGRLRALSIFATLLKQKERFS